MKIENGIVYFDKLHEQIGIGSLFGAVGSMALMVTGCTLIGLVWWAGPWNLHTLFWGVLRTGMSAAIILIAISMASLVWQMPTMPR